MDRRVIPVGAVLAGTSFFLPYIQSPSFFGERETITGVSMGSWAWVVPVAAGIILLGNMLWDAPQTQEVGQRLMVSGSGLGLAMLVFAVYELTRDRLFGASAWDIGVRPAVGPFLTLAGFLLAFVGARRLPRSPVMAISAPVPLNVDAGNSSPGAFSMPADAGSAASATPPLSDELAKHVRATGRLFAQWGRAATKWLRGLDLRARYARNSRRVWTAAAVVVVSTAVYMLFIRPSPEKMGRSAALAFASCREAYVAEVQKAEKALLPRLAAGAFRTRGAASGAWNQMLQERRPGYQECVTGAQQGLVRTQERFKGERLDRFVAAFNELPGVTDAAEVESSSQSGDLLTRIHSIQAPAPSEAEVRQHLLGRSIEGWSFDEPSEFRALRFSDVRVRGDTLWMRAEADLVDHISQEEYRTVLELRYRASESGDWQSLQVEPVLVAPASAEYKSRGDVFLVGRWRWPQNYALYNADGTWRGRWDDGSEHAGRWRIIRDRLVLTRGTSNWWSGHIHSWSHDSLRVGGGNGVLVLRWNGTATSAEAVPQASASPPRRATINDPDGYTNLRSRPTVDAPIITRISENEEFAVAPSTADWWQVRTAAGDTGYVHRSRVRLIP